jgi:hypothetical protein
LIDPEPIAEAATHAALDGWPTLVGSLDPCGTTVAEVPPEKLTPQLDCPLIASGAVGVLLTSVPDCVIVTPA